VQQQLEQFEKLTREMPQLREIYLSPVVPAGSRHRIIDSIFEGAKADPDVKNFLKLLADKKRTAYLPAIVAQLVQLIDEANGLVAVKVTSAVPLDQDSLSRLQKQMEVHTGKSVRLEPHLDPKVLGGLVIQIEHTIIDSSVRFQLETLRQHLRLSGNDVFSDSDGIEVEGR
jgi:F-type H+-transporting ATPase subunit delta